MKRKPIMTEMEHAIRDRAVEMLDGDEIEIRYTVNIIRKEIAVAGEEGERMYTKDEFFRLVQPDLLRV